MSHTTPLFQAIRLASNDLENTDLYILPYLLTVAGAVPSILVIHTKDSTLKATVRPRCSRNVPTEGDNLVNISNVRGDNVII